MSSAARPAPPRSAPPRPDAATLGALIAGGHARRFGGEPKGCVRLPDGTRPVDRAADALRAVCPRVVIVGRADHPYGHLGLPVIPDAIADRGAPGGVLGAVEHAAPGWVAVLPVDLPHVGADLLTALWPHRRGHATLWRADGRLQPLIGWWHTDAGPGLRAALTDHAPGFNRLVAGLTVHVVDAPEPARFFNLNRPEDLARLTPPGAR